MALTTVNPTGTKPYTVLRAICMAGERVEVGATVELTNTQGTELASAGKVGPYVEPEVEPEAAPAPKAKKQKPAPDADAPEETPDVPV